MSDKEGAERTYWICRAFLAAPPETTVRGVAEILGISKSNVFLHLKDKSKEVCPELVEEINDRLQENKRRARRTIPERARKYWREQNEQRQVKETTRK